MAKKEFKAFGKKISVEPQQVSMDERKREALNDSITKLNEYRDASQTRKEKAINTEKWFQALHWDEFRKKEFASSPEPTTNYLLSNIINKHADMMDGFPKPNILPKEEQDEQLAEQLTSIIPVVFERNKFKNVYNEAAYTKLKHGYCYYASTWDGDKNRIGDIDITEIDILKLYHEPNIKNLQDSECVFVVDLVKDDKLKVILEKTNPEAVGAVGSHDVIQVKHFETIDNVDYSDYTLIIDKYYKSNGQLHYMKFIEGAVLFWTEDDKWNEEEFMKPITQTTVNPMTGQPIESTKLVNPFAKGLYEHGQYPIVVDRLIPEPGTIYGIGFVDIMKNPQMFIDKFDQIIIENLAKSGKTRFLKKKGANIDEKDLLDWSKPIIEVEGNVTEAEFREFKVQQIDPKIIEYRTSKIGEIKEISSVNEFSRGEASGGVTAYRAIAVMQQAASKVSRDMMSQTYEAYRQLTMLTIENVRQFYDAARMFRITNDEGTFEFMKFENSAMKEQVDAELGIVTKSEFDITVVPEKDDPFSQAADNEFMIELVKLGFFNPENVDQSLMAVEMMKFEGKEKIKKMLMELKQEQALMQQLAVENKKLKTVLQGNYGIDMGLDIERMQQEQMTPMQKQQQAAQAQQQQSQEGSTTNEQNNGVS